MGLRGTQVMEQILHTNFIALTCLRTKSLFDKCFEMMVIKMLKQQWLHFFVKCMNSSNFCGEGSSCIIFLRPVIKREKVILYSFDGDYSADRISECLDLGIITMKAPNKMVVCKNIKAQLEAISRYSKVPLSPF